MYKGAKIIDRKKAIEQQIQALEETLKTTSSIALKTKLILLRKELKVL